MYSTPLVLRRAITIIDGDGDGDGSDGAGLQTGLRGRENGKP